MKPTDLTEFQNLMLGMFETYGQETSNTRLNVYKEALKPYEINSIRGALNILIRRSKFIPKPADIIELIDGASGNKHLSSSEVWAIALSANDESNTVVWTDEMHKAWATAENVMLLGDEVGARRAFIECYERLVAESINFNKPINITVSLGYDKSKRESVINKAVFTGLLSQENANHYLPKPENTFAMLENKSKTQTAKTMPKSLYELKARIQAEKKKNAEAWEIEKGRLHESLQVRYGHLNAETQSN